MRYKGHEIDPVGLWSEYVDFPPGMVVDGMFLPLVQCPNPDHDTLKAHFQINVKEPLVHCFAQCGISGTYARAISLIEGLYVKFDIEGAKSERERRQRIRRVHREADKIILRKSRPARAYRFSKAERSSSTARNISSVDVSYDTYLPPIAQDYLKKRGISARSIALWEIGWDSDEKRIVIPVKDERGRTRMLIRRAVFERQQPKYLYSEGFDKTSLLFGACFIDLGMVRSGGVVLVEGSIDAIRLRQHGIQAVATLGTGISDKQVELLPRLARRVYLMFDKDLAGVHGIEIAERKLRTQALLVCRYPPRKHDPAELSREEAYHSIEHARPLVLWKREIQSPKKST